MKTGKRIQVTTSTGRGGRESLPLALHRAWKQRGIECVLLGGQGTPLAVEHAADVVPVPRGYLGLAREVRAHVKTTMLASHGAPPIVISHFTHDLPALRIALRGMPNVPLMVIKHVSPGRPKKDLAHRWSYARVTRLLAVSEYVAAKCRRVYPIAPELIAVWHPGIDVSRFAFNAQNRTRIRDEHRATDEQQIIGYIGRVTPNKGLEDLLGAFQSLVRDHPAACLWIVGGVSPDEREYEAGLHQLVRDSGLGDAVRFCGHQDSVQDYISALDLFVTPSREEAFGLTTIEAMASGRPVAGFRAGGTAEIVAEGETGLLADPHGDAVLNLKIAISAILSDPERSRVLGEAGRVRALQRFSIEAMTSRLDGEIQACHK